MEICEGDFPLEKTLCKDCVHRLTKVMVPFDYDMLGINPDDYNLDIENGEELVMEQHICLISNEDLEAIVLECNKFKREEESFISKRLL